MKEGDGSTESCELTPPTSPAASTNPPLPTPISDTTPTPASPSPGGSKNRKRRDGTSLRKAPQAPKRFKSSYILFFMEKQEEIKSQLPKGSSVGDVSKKSSELWKKLSPEERAHWDARAEKDKERFMNEKAAYTGPWQIPWKRAKKDPSAPKRPMSAFLYFSQDRRGSLKSVNPTMRNTEISSILGKLWRDATDEDRRPYVERELHDRNKYKAVLATWKKEDKIRKEAEKEEKTRKEKEEEKERERVAESERLMRERMEWEGSEYHRQGYYYGQHGGRSGELTSPRSPLVQPGECFSPYTGGYTNGLQQRGQQRPQVQGGFDLQGMYNPMPYSGTGIPRPPESPHRLNPKVHTQFQLSNSHSMEYIGHADNNQRGIPYPSLGSVKREEHQHSPNLLQRQSQPHHIPMLNANHMLNIPAMKHEEQESNLSPMQQIKSMQSMQPQHLASMVIPRLPSREQINHYPLDIQQQSQQIVGTVGGGEIERQPYEFTYMPVPSNAADRDPENFNFQNDPFSAGLHD